MKTTVKAMCVIRHIDIKLFKNLMQMVRLNEAMDQLVMTEYMLVL